MGVRRPLTRHLDPIVIMKEKKLCETVSVIRWVILWSLDERGDPWLILIVCFSSKEILVVFPIGPFINIFPMAK